MKLTKKQKRINKKAKHMLTKAYANKIIKKHNKEQLKLWSIEVRNEANNVCSFCNKAGLLHSHHVLPKETYKEFKFDIINGVCLCPLHHKFGKLSAHKNTIWFSVWLQEKHPEKYAWVILKLKEEEDKNGMQS